MPSKRPKSNPSSQHDQTSKPTSEKSSPSRELPKNWPATIRYLTRPAYSPALTTSDLFALRPSTPSSSLPRVSPPAGPSPHALIRPITSPATHPALGQHGLFAVRDLPASSFVLPYLGYVHPPADTDPDSSYDLSLDRYLGIGIDATRMGNEARFVNDYRGIRGEGPNAEFREVLFGSGERGMGVWVMGTGKKGGKGKAGIKKGEEIVVSYGRGFWKARVDEEAEVDGAVDGDEKSPKTESGAAERSRDTSQ